MCIVLVQLQSPLVTGFVAAISKRLYVDQCYDGDVAIQEPRHEITSQLVNAWLAGLFTQIESQLAGQAAI